jgi:hypothetical protein
VVEFHEGFEVVVDVLFAEVGDGGYQPRGWWWALEGVRDDGFGSYE